MHIFRMGLGLGKIHGCSCGPALPAGPISVSDFKNGVYSLGGAPKTFNELWCEKLAYGDFDETSLLNGIGIYISSEVPTESKLYTTDDHWAAFNQRRGFTVVLDYLANQLHAAAPQVMVEAVDPLGITGTAGFQHDGTSVSWGNLRIYDGNAILHEEPAGPPGNYKAAVTISYDVLEYSINGDPVVTASGDPADHSAADGIGLSCLVRNSSNPGLPATITLRSATFYPPRPAADLPGLSA